MADLYKVMLEALSEGIDVRGMIDLGARLLGNPILIVDLRFRIPYMSDSKDLDVDLWNRAGMEGVVSDEVLAALQKNKTVEQLMDSDAPVFDALPNGYRAVRCALRNGKLYCGFIGMYDYTRPITEEAAQGLSVLAKAVSVLLAGNPDFAISNTSGYSAYLHQLLRCESMEQTELVCRRMSNYPLPSRKLLLCVGASDHSSMPLLRFADLLPQLPVTASILYDQRLVILLDDDKWEETDAHRERLVGLCEEFCLKAGASFPFSEDAYVPLAYRQAELCLEALEPDASSPLLSFESVYMDTFVHLCRSAFQTQLFSHPIIQRIQAYDREYRVHYLDTLRLYLQCGCNLKTCADTLKVHYNTIKHRMSVIEDIAGRDIRNDIDLQSQLRIALLFVERDEFIQPILY